MSLINTIRSLAGKILKTLGEVQSFILLALFYYLILGPLALIIQVKNKLLRKSQEENTYWVKRPSRKPTIDNLKKQY